MIEIKKNKNDKPYVEYKAAKFFDAEILNDNNDKCIRFHFFRHDGERDWWVLYPYAKYADREQPDCIKIDDKRYSGDDLYRLAREIMLKKVAESLDILEG